MELVRTCSLVRRRPHIIFQHPFLHITLYNCFTNPHRLYNTGQPCSHSPWEPMLQKRTYRTMKQEIQCINLNMWMDFGHYFLTVRLR